MRNGIVALLLSATVACGKHESPAPTPQPAPPAAAAAGAPATGAPAASLHSDRFKVTEIALPGGGPDGIGMDFLLYDPRTKAVWVPAGNTGSVDVVDATSLKIARIDGFPTQDIERNGKKRSVGPSSATLGPNQVYIGNRGDSTICSMSETMLTKGACGKLDSMPDGIAYVATTNEVWVTTPRDKSIRILDATSLTQKARLPFDGDPEGYAVDAKRNRFYTNLEDKNVTLAVDLTSHKSVSTWPSSCGENGPHGLRLDEQAGWLFVACSAKTEVMDLDKGGAILGSVDTGDGADDLDYDQPSHTLYVAGAKAATLTIATVGANGAPTATAVAPTVAGARNAAVAARGQVFLSHSKGSELVLVTPVAAP